MSENPLGAKPALDQQSQQVIEAVHSVIHPHGILSQLQTSERVWFARGVSHLAYKWLESGRDPSWCLSPQGVFAYQQLNRVLEESKRSLTQ